MRHSALTLVSACVAFFLACGSGHPTIQSMQTSPASATAQSPLGEVGFTARGMFSNGNSRELTVADNLQWSSSNTMIATIDKQRGPGDLQSTRKRHDHRVCTCQFDDHCNERRKQYVPDHNDDGSVDLHIAAVRIMRV